MTLAEAIEAGYNVRTHRDELAPTVALISGPPRNSICALAQVPREIHAWKNMGHENLINPEHVGGGMMGAPKDMSFTLPGQYKKPGCDLWRVDASKFEVCRER